jgi:iron complex outermembrane receptor protein
MSDKALLLIVYLLSGFNIFAQSDTTRQYTLETVTVSVQRLEGKQVEVPLAITNLQVNRINEASQQLSINEQLNGIPGLFALNANNYAQDLRVSIRGFGARSSFGIRGVKILVDGIPETTPDGQGQIDNLDLALIDNIEVLRGPSSGLYGNASGGVISIQSRDQVERNFISLGTTFGSFGMQRYQLKGGWKKNKTSVVLSANHMKSDGFRQNSEFSNTTLSSNIRHRFSNRSTLRLLLNYTDSPTANDPGGVDIETVNSDRRSARQRNIDFQAGESIQQFKTALIYTHCLKNNDKVNTKAFYINRQFLGRLPFADGGVVELGRHYLGQESNYTTNQRLFQQPLQMQWGYNLHYQVDDRQRFINEEGQRGALNFSQEESFLNLGIFWLNRYNWRKQFLLNTSLRYDFNQLEAEDQLLVNGDASGQQQYSVINGSIGLSYIVYPQFTPYVRYSSSFETPALSELSANPSGREGFNPGLKPQNALNIEVGAKGIWKGKIRYELTYFNIRTQNEILPFELAAFPERNFFRNAGQTNRSGVETSISYAFAKHWRTTFTYTYSDFTFNEYRLGTTMLDGEQLPGLPRHFGSLSFSYFPPNKLFFRLQVRQVGELYVNDANSVKDDAYTLINLQLGFKQSFKGWDCLPFLGINNLLNTNYNDNIRINALGSRYFEPGPGVNIYGGVRVKISGGER